MAKVTAIIIVLDGEAYLREAIESAQSQSLGDWELLIVDDGSADASLAIARESAQADHRIRVLRHPDSATHGMSATRNLGLHQATGEYVAFLDADDVWRPDKLEEQAGILDRHPSAAMVYGRTLIWHEWPGSAGKDFFYDLGVPAESIYDPPRLFLQLLKNVHQTPTTCNAMIRRDAALEVGGFDASFPGMFEDQILFAKLLMLYPAYVSGRQWAKYRQHSGSISSRVDAAELHRTHLRYLRVLRKFAIERHKRFSSERLAVERIVKKAEWSELRRRVRAARRWLRI